jgi:hypothetical protein
VRKLEIAHEREDKVASALGSEAVTLGRISARLDLLEAGGNIGAAGCAAAIVEENWKLHEELRW